MKNVVKSKEVICALSVVLFACSSGEQEELAGPEKDTAPAPESTLDREVASRDSVAKPPGGPESSLLPVANDLVPKGSPSQRSEVNLPPIVDSGSKAPLRLVYYEHPDGGLAEAVVNYYTEDGSGVLASVQAPYDLNQEWTFNGSGALELRVEGSLRGVVHGSMKLKTEDGSLKIEFRDLEFAGTSMSQIDGYVVGALEEQCYQLVEQETPDGLVPPSNSAAPDTRVHMIDENWESTFCSSVQRLVVPD